MIDSYEEILDGESVRRREPDARHEKICGKLRSQIAESLASIASTQLLDARSVVQINSGTFLRPDISLVTSSTGKLWLAAEIISSQDHRIDTVLKKAVYEELNLPRLWMVDLRYDNVEVYHGTQYGLALRHILAGREALTEQLLPEFQVVIQELFQNA